MRKKKAERLEVMQLEITAASAQAREVIARLDTLIAVDRTGLPTEWTVDLYDRRMEMNHTLVWLESWLDAIKQKQ